MSMLKQTLNLLKISNLRKNIDERRRAKPIKLVNLIIIDPINKIEFSDCSAPKIIFHCFSNSIALS